MAWGMLGRVQLVRDRSTRVLFAPSLAVAERVMRRARELGVIFRQLPSDGLSFSPPLCLTESEADTIVAVIDQAIGDVAKSL